MLTIKNIFTLSLANPNANRPTSILTFESCSSDFEGNSMAKDGSPINSVPPLPFGICKRVPFLMGRLLGQEALIINKHSLWTANTQQSIKLKERGASPQTLVVCNTYKRRRLIFNLSFLLYYYSFSLPLPLLLSFLRSIGCSMWRGLVPYLPSGRLSNASNSYHSSLTRQISASALLTSNGCLSC